MTILDGRVVVEDMRKRHVENLRRLEDARQKRASLFILADLSHRPSQLFVQRKFDYAASVGVDVVIRDASQMTTEEAVEEVANCRCDGVLVQLPCPHPTNPLIAAIDPHKDVEGFHPFNLGRLTRLGGIKGVPAACTARAVQILLGQQYEPFSGLHVVVVNDTFVLGKPLAMLLNGEGFTVTLCNHLTANVVGIARSADILVTAVGKDSFNIEPLLANRPLVVDVGCRHKDGKMVGDLPPELRPLTSGYSPVPGGVGPLTVACVVDNLVGLIDSQPPR